MHAQALAEFASQLPATHASAVSYVGSQLRDGWRRLAAAEGKLSEEVQSAKGELDSLQTSVRDLADRADKWDARLRRMYDWVVLAGGRAVCPTRTHPYTH